MPRVGDVVLEPGACRSQFNSTDDRPGYYSVQLNDSNVRTDITAIDKVALYRFIFPETEQEHVMIDISHTLSAFRGGEVHLFDGKTIQGTATYETEDGTLINVAFCAQFSKPFRRRGTWNNGEAKDGQNRAEVGDASRLGAFVYFWTHEGESILMKMGLFTESIEDARKNIEHEFPGWDFDDVQLGSEQAWK